MRYSVSEPLATQLAERKRQRAAALAAYLERDRAMRDQRRQDRERKRRRNMVYAVLKDQAAKKARMQAAQRKRRTLEQARTVLSMRLNPEQHATAIAYAKRVIAAHLLG